MATLGKIPVCCDVTDTWKLRKFQNGDILICVVTLKVAVYTIKYTTGKNFENRRSVWRKNGWFRFSFFFSPPRNFLSLSSWRGLVNSAGATLTNNAAKYFKGLFDRATPIKWASFKRAAFVPRGPPSSPRSGSGSVSFEDQPTFSIFAVSTPSPGPLFLDQPRPTTLDQRRGNFRFRKSSENFLFFSKREFFRFSRHVTTQTRVKGVYWKPLAGDRQSRSRDYRTVKLVYPPLIGN